MRRRHGQFRYASFARSFTDYNRVSCCGACGRPDAAGKMMGSAGLSQYRKKEKEKSEEDGNGDSLFDF